MKYLTNERTNGSASREPYDMIKPLSIRGEYLLFVCLSVSVSVGAVFRRLIMIIQAHTQVSAITVLEM